MSSTTRPIIPLPVTPLRRHEGARMARWFAYITGIPVMDLKIRRTHRRRDKDVVFAARYGAEGLSLAELARRVEAAERRENSVIGRRIEFPLPSALSDDAAIDLSKDLAYSLYRILGTPVMFGLHRKGSNLHVHFLVLPRVWLEATREFGDRARDMDVPYRGGVLLGQIRVEFAKLVNQRLPQNEQVSCLPKPSGPRRRHLGHGAHRLEKEGVATLHGNYNRLVDEYDEVERKLAILRRQKKEQELGLAPVKLSEDTGLPPSVLLRDGEEAAKKNSPAPRVDTRERQLAFQTPATTLSWAAEARKALVPLSGPSTRMTYGSPAAVTVLLTQQAISAVNPRSSGLTASAELDPVGELTAKSLPNQFIMNVLKMASTVSPLASMGGSAAKLKSPDCATTGGKEGLASPSEAGVQRLKRVDAEIEELLSPPRKGSGPKVGPNPAMQHPAGQFSSDAQGRHPLPAPRASSPSSVIEGTIEKANPLPEAKLPPRASSEDGALLARPPKPRARPSSPQRGHPRPDSLG